MLSILRDSTIYLDKCQQDVTPVTSKTLKTIAGLDVGIDFSVYCISVLTFTSFLCQNTLLGGPGITARPRVAMKVSRVSAATHRLEKKLMGRETAPVHCRYARTVASWRV
jgi:hypothetical protein